MSALSLIHISSLPPTSCGVAEYTHALTQSLHANSGKISPFYVRIDNDAEDFRQAGDCITINPSDEAAISAMAKSVNQLKRKVVFLQHEFKLYGAPDGENVLQMLDAIKAPVITTLHTVWPSFAPSRHRVFVELLRRSGFVVVFSERAARIVSEDYRIDVNRVKVIPHGVPDLPFRNPAEVKWSTLPNGSVNFITAGLLRSAKGIENVLAAFGNLKRTFNDFQYVICGADHPRSLGAAAYRSELMTLAARHGLENHVVFVNRFLELNEMVEVIQACDVGILAYTGSEQSSSGVLALFLSCGRPVIATDFQYAKATLNDSNGIVVPMGDVGALTAAIESLASDMNRREQMMKNSYDSTRSWIWRMVVQKHLDIAYEAQAHPASIAWKR